MNKNHACNRVLAGLLLFCVLLSLGVSPAQAVKEKTTPPPQDPIERLVQASGGSARVSLEKATGFANFVRVTPGSLPFRLSRASAAQAGSQGLAFLQAYGRAFGVQDSSAELRLSQAWTDSTGAAHSAFRQFYRGIPVYGGELRVHFDSQGRLTGASGLFVPEIQLDTQPVLSKEQAALAAIAHVKGNGGQKDRSDPVPGISLTSGDPVLYVYRTHLAEDLPGQDHLIYRVEVGDGGQTRRFVFIDAHSGVVIDDFTGVFNAINRQIYLGGIDPDIDSPLVWKEGDGPYAGAEAAGINRLHDYAQDIYNVFASVSGGSWLSWDGSDGTMRLWYDPADGVINCPNAFWNGTYTAFCAGMDGDDTVGHEWSHAYVEGTNDLIYFGQSGALNEAYADIWGEVADLLNGDGLDDAADTRRTDGNCSTHTPDTLYSTSGPDNAYRWLSGEDDSTGAIRDLWNPTCYMNPGKLSDSEFACGLDDNGGVHTNSGIPEHAFALLTDGGTYNGQTVRGIGQDKAAAIYWRAQKEYHNEFTDFAYHADSLEMACGDLTGQTIYKLSTSSPVGTPLEDSITADDCTQVSKAIQAVELRGEATQCNVLNDGAPGLCSGGQVLDSIYKIDWENGLGGWNVGTRNIANLSTFQEANWTITGALPGDHSGKAAFAEDMEYADAFGSFDQRGVRYLESPDIHIPASAGPAQLAFDHWMNTEMYYDGGNIKVSKNGGEWKPLQKSDFSFNGYNSTLWPLDDWFGASPLAGEEVFSGSNWDLISGRWGRSIASLTNFVGGGDRFRLRFEIGTDAYNAYNWLVGWFLDDVQIYQCIGASYGVDVKNPPDDQMGEPGKPVVYHLQLANTGNQNDSYTLAVSGNNWPVDLPSALVEVQAGASQEILAQVNVPSSARVGDKDTVTITVTSSNDASKKITLTLTTSITNIGKKLYLPLLLPNQ